MYGSMDEADGYAWIDGWIDGLILVGWMDF